MTVTEGKRVLVDCERALFNGSEIYGVRHFNIDNRLCAGKGTHNQKNFIADLVRDCRKTLKP